MFRNISAKASVRMKSIRSASVRSASVRTASVMIVCAAFVCSTLLTVFSYGANAVGGTNGANDANEVNAVNAIGTNALNSKTETVYVIADADGNTQKVIVSDWLRNAAASAEIKDKTSLTGIENVKGNETYTGTGGGAMVWNAGGSDIYYQGQTDKTPPVKVSVSYKLDGKSITAKELAGKSGKVTIRFDYTNTQYETKEIDGEKTKIYVPFVMISGLMLDNERFSNICVTNGKAINDGSRTVAVGFALPAMQESLGIDEKTLDIPEYVEITADTNGFKLDTTLTLATNEFFSNMDLSKFGDTGAGEMTDSAAQLTDAVNRLSDGSSALYDGLSELASKLPELTDGIDKLSDGVKELYDGSASLNSGASSLYSGLKSLNSGLGTLVSNSGALNDGAKQVFASLLSAADSSLAAAGLTGPALTADNYRKTLDGATASLNADTIRAAAKSEALKKVTEQVNANKEAITKQITENYYDKVLTGVLSASGLNLTAEQYAQAAAAGKIDAGTQASVKAAVSAQIDKLTAQQIQKLIDENMAGEAVAGQIEAAVAKAAAGRTQLLSLEAQLDSYSAFYNGLISYTKGVSDAYAGSSRLYSGAATLAAGSKQLNAGLATLKEAAGTLKNGGNKLPDAVNKLEDGAKELSDGIKQFRDEGISKLASLIGGNISDAASAVERLRAAIDISNGYNSFAGISDGMSGSVKFIYRTGSIG